MSFCITQKTGGILRDENSVLHWRDRVVSFDRMRSSFLYRSKNRWYPSRRKQCFLLERWVDQVYRYRISIRCNRLFASYLQKRGKRDVVFALDCVCFLDLCNTNRYFLEEERGGIILTPTILLRLRSH